MSLKLGATVKKLQAHKNSPYSILSIYLDLHDLKSFNKEKLHNKFHQVINSNLNYENKKLFVEDLFYCEEFIRTAFKAEKDQKGLALFIANDHFFEVLDIDFQIPDKAIASHDPFLQPIIDYINYYKRYLVILADREKGKVFTIHMGDLEIQEEIKDKEFVPQNIRPQGSGGHSISRHVRQHLHDHIQFIMNKSEWIFKNKAISGVIIGGHKELLHDIREHLPANLKSKVVAEFISELNIPLPDIAQKSKLIINQLNRSFAY